MSQPVSSVALRIVPPTEAPRVPPHDVDAERAVISACLVSGIAGAGGAASLVVDFLRPEHFFIETHRRIFEAIVALHAAGIPTEQITVATWLREHERYDQIGRMATLTELLDATPAISNVRTHAVGIFNAWRQREIIAAAQRVEAAGYFGVGDLQQFSEQVAAAFVTISRSQPGQVHESNVDTLARQLRELHAADRATTAATTPTGARRMTGIPTGIECLDQLTGGLHAGEKFTVAALPGVGKTAFGLQIAMHVASLGIAVYFASTEMSRDELADRQVAFLSGVDSKRIQRARTSPTLTPSEWPLVTDGSRAASRLPIVVDDDSSMTIDDLTARVTSLAETSVLTHGAPLGLVVLDYVQNLRPSKAAGFKTLDQITYSTKAFKRLLATLKIPGIELAQARKLEVDKKTGSRPAPQLGDIADCKAVSDAANAELHLYRKDERNGRDLTAALRKQRSGPVGEFWLTLDAKRGRFTDKRLEADRQYVDDGKAWYER